MDHIITDRPSLRHRIMQLNAQKEDQEILMKGQMKELYYSLHFSTMIRKTVQNLSSDQQFKTDSVKGVLNFGAGFLLDKMILRKGAGIRAYLLNAGLKKALSYFIAKKSDQVFIKEYPEDY